MRAVPQPIRYTDLDTGAVQEEEVYGGFWVKLLYGTWLGRFFSALIAAPPFSRLYGWLQDRAWSRRKVAPFIERFDIQMDDFLPEEGRSAESPFSTFNQFFTRRVTEAARPFAKAPSFPAPCDARYFAYAELNDDVSIPVKGAFFKASALLRNEEWQAHFEDGPGFIARLCPVDYHRFHFPDDGEVLASWRVAGALHSVNPWALAFRQDIFMLNEREVTILETEHFGKLAFIEVGATCVGKIKQTYTDKRFSRGDEKGMFLFGGSTVIVIGEKGRWKIDPAILDNTAKHIETYLKMGRALGEERTATEPTV
ncbi:MAG: phosphatidylserine decarboxylase [Nannocystaceae bacterium]|nr:phosphatidylserine decarboxylase [Nannocystaceae bacterium]